MNQNNSKYTNNEINSKKHPELETIFEQHYEHSRHQEIQRGAFITVISSILGGVLALATLTYNDLSENQLVLPIFITGFFISFLVFILIYTWNKPFIRHYTYAEIILIYYWNLGELSRFDSRYFKGYKNGDTDYKQLDETKWTTIGFLKDATSNNISYYLNAALFVIYSLFLSNSIANSCEKKQITNIFAPFCNFGFPNSEVIFVILMIALVIILRIYFAKKEKDSRFTIVERINKYMEKSRNNNKH